MFACVRLVGLGLMGGSLSLALRAALPGLVLTAMDADAQPLDLAKKRGWVDACHLLTPGERLCPQDWLSDVPTLWVLCAPLSQNQRLLKALAPQLPEAHTITDVGSCKRRIVALGEQHWPTQFIGGHPLAGRETSGIAQSTSHLFFGQPWLLCPHAQTPPDRLEALENLICALGALPQRIDAQAHDATMAGVSHFPQLLATLAASFLAQQGCNVSQSGSGLRDTLRLAGSSYSVWQDILDENADHLAPMIDAMGDLLKETAFTLGSDDCYSERFLPDRFDMAQALYAQILARGDGVAVADRSRI
jgi:prephenate dehydrogenase